MTQPMTQPAGMPAGVPGQEPGDQVQEEQTATEAAQPSPFAVGKGGRPIPPDRLKDRLVDEARRAEAKFLRAEYGTSDPAKVAQIRKERADAIKYAAEHRTKDEERRRAEMSERERLEADLAKERAERERAQAELTDLRQQATVEKQTQQLTEIAGKHVAPQFTRYAIVDFNRHLRTLSVEDHRRLTPRAIERWFAKYAEENSVFAATPAPKSAPKAPAQPVAPTRREGISTTRAAKGGPPRPAAPSAPTRGDLYKGKTPKPGLPNSMNRTELREYMNAKGLKAW